MVGKEGLILFLAIGVGCVTGSGCGRGGRPGPPPKPGEAGNELRQHVIQTPDGIVTITGGYQSDPRDGGRPVKLIASSLGVEEQIFRDAFSKVQPSQWGPPSPLRAQQNKKVLMDALGKHGVSNERLDEVSNFYRYRPGSSELWQHRDADLLPIYDNGQLTGLEIKDGGYGYLSPPQIAVDGQKQITIEVDLGFDRELMSNGQIKSIRVENQNNNQSKDSVLPE